MTASRTYVDYLADILNAIDDIVWQTISNDIPPTRALIDAVPTHERGASHL